MRCNLCVASSFAALLAIAGVSHAAPFFAENFDVDPTANWTVNNNNNGTNAASFFFDYSTVGIPSAPNSTGGTTRGLKLGANIGGVAPAGGALSGISVSPTGQSFTGNYELKFDWWHNWLGAAYVAGPPASGGIGASAGGSGSTQLSTFGILTSGTVANYAGISDSVFYGATGDGASASDYRTYSSEKPTSYALADAHNVYAAGSLNNTNAYYATPFPGGKTAPAAQIGISSTQNGTSLVGTSGFQWNQVSIKKAGTVVTWTVNGTLIATTDTANFTTATGGTNILFGQADTSNGAGTPAALFAQLDFTLIDNVRVVPEPSSLVLLLTIVMGCMANRWRRS